jgi:hypothetical protein
MNLPRPVNPASKIGPGSRRSIGRIALKTDRAAVREAVINFTRHALGCTRNPTEARIEAVTSALLDDAWLPAADTALDEDYNPAISSAS